jgi:hypothetical protein
MIKKTRTLMSVVVLTSVMIVGRSPSYGKESPNAIPTDKQYWVDATVFSMEQEKGLESFRNYGSGGTEPTGTLGLGASTGDRNFTVSIKGKMKAGRFLADVSVTPKQGDHRTAEMYQVFDLSDLKPRQLELARDSDGRVYCLNLAPRVTERPAPKTFRAADLSLEKWRFQDSQIILNDQDYLGTLNMAGAPIGWIDIPGFAKVEFSLLPLNNSKPEGVLEDGTIRFSHNNETRLRITNVRNGVESAPLAGGPYQVWVRWSAPTQTIEQYRESIKARLEAIKQQIKGGDIELPQGTVERLERELSSDRILQIDSGICGVRVGDVDSPEQ